MFIYLSDSLNSDEIIKSHLDAFRNLATAAIEGNHIVVGDQPTLKRLAQSEVLGTRDRGAYLSLYHNNLQSLNAIKNQLTIYVVVVAEDSDREESFPDKIVLNISEFNRSSLIQPTILLGENIKDAKIYKKIATTYLEKNRMKFKTVRIKCILRGGGGPEIATAFKSAQIEEVVFCLGIADSDKEAPASKSKRGLDGYGATAKALTDSHTNNYTARCEIHIIPVRDIENLFFYEIYEYFLKKIPTKEKELLFFQELVNLYGQHTYQGEEHHILHYADIKEGTKLGKILTKNPGHPVYKFWLGYANYLFNTSNLCRDFIQSDCINNEVCLKNKDSDKFDKKKCECFITPSLGKILEKVYTYFDEKDRRQEESTFLDFLSYSCLEDPMLGEVWEEISEKVTAWCCSVEPIRTPSADISSNTV